MAICKRDNCTNSIGGSNDERKLRLCTLHCQGRQRNASKRDERKLAQCQYQHCNKSLKNSRNKRFCSTGCRNKARRLIDDDAVVKLINHSWWLSIESMLKNNPFGIESINDPDDISAMLRLYQRKAVHQRSYNILHGEWVLDTDGQPLRRLRPWLELEISHRYPNSKGGSNVAKNLLIAPKSINRMLKDSLPHWESDGKYNGLKSVGDIVPVKKTLLNALVNKFGPESVHEALQPVKHVHFADIAKVRKLVGINIYTHPPLLTLLREETLRLQLYELRNAVKDMADYQMFTDHEIDTELLALACFHALLNGDAKSFLNHLSQLPLYASGSKNPPDEIKDAGIYNWYTSQLHVYMMYYFGLDMTDLEECIKFYNRLFTVAPLDEIGEIIIMPLTGSAKYCS